MRERTETISRDNGEGLLQYLSEWLTMRLRSDDGERTVEEGIAALVMLLVFFLLLLLLLSPIVQQ